MRYLPKALLVSEAALQWDRLPGFFLFEALPSALSPAEERLSSASSRPEAVSHSPTHLPTNSSHREREPTRGPSLAQVVPATSVPALMGHNGPRNRFTVSVNLPKVTQMKEPGFKAGPCGCQATVPTVCACPPLSRGQGGERLQACGSQH